MEDNVPGHSAEMNSGGEEESPYTEGWNEIANAIANVLERDKVVDALGNWLNSHATSKPQENKFRWGALIVGHVFSLLIFAGIVFVGWKKIISAEATTGLLGALVGYWYGQRERAGKS